MGATMQRRTLPSGERFVTLKDVAEAFGISHKHAYNLAADGRIAHVRLGKAIRVPASEIDRLRAEASRPAAGS